MLRPNLKEEDFKRESGLQITHIEARADNPVGVANLASRALLFGEKDYRGHYLQGYAATVKGPVARRRPRSVVKNSSTRRGPVYLRRRFRSGHSIQRTRPAFRLLEIPGNQTGSTAPAPRVPAGPSGPWSM